MTKDKFQLLCERVLIPRMGDLLHARLASVHETLDIMAAELARIETMITKLAAFIRDARGDDFYADR